MEEFTTFGELKYERPDFEKVKSFYADVTKKLKNAKEYDIIVTGSITIVIFGKDR